MWASLTLSLRMRTRCRVARRLCAGGGLMNGKVILHWFNIEENINPEVNLNMLKTVLWPKVR